MSFSGNMWVKFNFFYFFLLTTNLIELFTQDMLRLEENHNLMFTWYLKAQNSSN